VRIKCQITQKFTQIQGRIRAARGPRLTCVLGQARKEEVCKQGPNKRLEPVWGEECVFNKEISKPKDEEEDLFNDKEAAETLANKATENTSKLAAVKQEDMRVYI